MRVIGVVGLPGSGKGEVSRIARENGIPVVVMGDAIRRRVTEAGMPTTDKNLGEMSRRLREEIGMDAIARLSIPVIESRSSPVVLVDGIRGDYEVETFRRQFPDFLLIGIRASFATRLARLVQRGRSDDTSAAADLQCRDERELGWGLGRALEQADTVIENDGTVGDLAIQVRELLRQAGSLP